MSSWFVWFCRGLFMHRSWRKYSQFFTRPFCETLLRKVRPTFKSVSTFKILEVARYIGLSIYRSISSATVIIDRRILISIELKYVRTHAMHAVPSKNWVYSGVFLLVAFKLPMQARCPCKLLWRWRKARREPAEAAYYESYLSICTVWMNKWMQLHQASWLAVAGSWSDVALRMFVYITNISQ